MRVRWVIALICGVGLAASVATLSADASEQVIFSGTWTADNGTNGPGGFWIWCESESDNPYAGLCQGAMYFYELGITEHVFGSISGEDSYTMSVSGRTLNCTLTNTTLVRGPKNTVIVSCNVGGGTSTNAVVKATGPSD